MKLTTTAQNPLEWLAIQSGIAPEPIAVGHFGYLISKFLLEAVDKGVFESIGKEKRTLQEIAAACKLHETALEKLLRLLASMGLIDCSNHYFSLTKKAKKWLLKDSPSSMYWLLMFDQKVCFNWMQYAGEYLKTGKGLQYHNTFSKEEWFYYQKAMESIAKNAAKEITRKVPSLTHPSLMLDIGGAHGLYADAFCKKYETLQATVLDLPPAIEQVKKMDKNPATDSRIHFQGGNVLLDDIGESLYDFILMASVAHHFTEAENILVAKKAYRAIKPGGYFTIIEVLAPKQIKKNGDMLGSIGDIFFSFSSTSGTWSLANIREWMTLAGFTVVKKASFIFLPGYIAISGKKEV